MYLKRLEISGFKSFAKKSVLEFSSPVSAIVGPNGSGKSNVAEAIRFVLGEQSLKSLRGKRGEDLIFSGTQLLSRQNRAKVTILFDNTKRVFDIDYDEVSISREVHRDSSNQYFINNSQVRLKDIVELLASVHIGASGHHIISQGEADRVLGASLKERKSMIEDALGLKIHQLKIGESEKRLTKTEDNIAQVGLLRKELMPHIRFLKAQVKKIQQAQGMREELGVLYREYLKREQVYIESEKSTLAQEIQEPECELVTLKEEIIVAQKTLSQFNIEKEQGDDSSELGGLEKDLYEVREKKNTISRELGRIEGVIEYEQHRTTRQHQVSKVVNTQTISTEKVSEFLKSIDSQLHEAEHTNDFGYAKKLIGEVKGALWDFSQALQKRDEVVKHVVVPPSQEDTLEVLTTKSVHLKEELVSVAQGEVVLTERIKEVQHAREERKDVSHDSEKNILGLRARERELVSRMRMLEVRTEQIKKTEQDFQEELSEGGVLIGRAVFAYEQYHIEESSVQEPRNAQEDRRKKIEKLKIRLEDMGGGSDGNVVKEYEETVERDEFLEKEITDLQASAESLRVLISDLQKKLSDEFRDGVKKINKQFQEFFALMFGGGSAKLEVSHIKPPRTEDGIEDVLMDENIVAQEGIDIAVNLPRKNIKGLQMLSGGERALTSIALLFAMSQVNPPPFLVLDETDAALDEANARKYGDMLANLSEYSQLIVITHNRETMSRAGILYGVTMDSDAASKLLSIKFNDAQEYAK